MPEWIEWYACMNEGRADGPLPANALVTVMMLDGEVWADEPAGAYNWAVQDAPGEIIAYKQIGWVLPVPAMFTEIRSGVSIEKLLEAAMKRIDNHN